MRTRMTRLWHIPKFKISYQSKSLEILDIRNCVQTEIHFLVYFFRLINNVLRAAQGSTLSQTCPQLLYHYHKQSNPRHYPTYRDILFLSLIAGRDTIEACKSLYFFKNCVTLQLKHDYLFCVWVIIAFLKSSDCYIHRVIINQL